MGRRRQPQRSRLARGISRTVLPAALSSRRRLDLRAGHRARDRPPQRNDDLAAAGKERDRFRVVVRRADRPADRPVAEAPRAGALRRRRREDAAGRRRQPAAGREGGWRGSGRRSQVRAETEPHAHGHGQSGLRPGRSGPGGRQPVGVRDVLLRAAALLRRGRRHLPVQRRLQRRQLQRPFLLAPHRPCAARRAVDRRGGVFRRAGADHDPRRGEADRARRRVLDRRAECDHGRRGCGDRPRHGGAPPDGRAADGLFGDARPPRVPQPVVGRVHRHGHQPEPR